MLFRSTERVAADVEAAVLAEEQAARLQARQILATYDNDRAALLKLRRDYLDLAATWRMSDRWEFRGGINNVFDKDPPLIGSGNLSTTFLNGNTAPQVYDALGRFIFFGVTTNW